SYLAVVCVCRGELPCWSALWGQGLVPWPVCAVQVVLRGKESTDFCIFFFFFSFFFFFFFFFF
ncbi:hypothetical protein DUI37_28465, partial [Bacillus anthracis]